MRDRQDDTVGQLTLLAYHCTRKQGLWRINTVKMHVIDSPESSDMALQRWLTWWSAVWVIFLLQTSGCVGKDSITLSSRSKFCKKRWSLVPFLYIAFLFAAVLGIKPRALHMTRQELCHWPVSSARLHFWLCSHSGRPGLARHREQTCVCVVDVLGSLYVSDLHLGSVSWVFFHVTASPLSSFTFQKMF